MRQWTICSVLSAALLALLANSAFAVWHTGGGTSYTAGTPQSPAPPWNPSDPNNTGLDGEFTNTGTPEAPGAKVMVQACCLSSNFCGVALVKGVRIEVTITVTTNNGAHAYSDSHECCPADCCDHSFTVSPSAGQNWGGHATGMTVKVSVLCICCNADGSLVISDPDEYPNHEYDLESLDPAE